MSIILSESMILAKTRSQDLKSVLKLNSWGSGIDDVTLVRKLANVEVIGLSCNEITTLEDFAYCPKLKELILRKNAIKNISEVAHLMKLPHLTNLWLSENPCAQNTHNYRKVVLKALPNLTVLDNIPVTREELKEIEELGNEIYEEIPYESTNSTGSATSSSGGNVNTGNNLVKNIQEPLENDQPIMNEVREPEIVDHRHQINTEPNFLTQTTELPDMSFGNTTPHINDSQYSNISHNRAFHHISRAHSLSNNNFLPKGGKSRNGNILSAILCLVKELDYVSCEVVQTALSCRMEELSQ